MTGAGSRFATWLSPSVIGIHLSAIAAIVVCAAMGMWQLGVYDERQAAEQAESSDVPTVPIMDLWGPEQSVTNVMAGRPVEFTARFRPGEEQFWVTGQGSAGASVWLVAPVEVEGEGAGETPLLVVRGQAEQVGELPDVPDGAVAMSGVIQPTQASSEPWDPGSRTIGSVRIPSLVNELPYNLWSGFVISTEPATSGGLALAEPPAPESHTSWTSGGRNLGYGLQWWAFGAFVLFMWWRMASDRVAALRQAQQDTRYPEADEPAHRD